MYFFPTLLSIVVSLTLAHYTDICCQFVRVTVWSITFSRPAQSSLPSRMTTESSKDKPRRSEACHSRRTFYAQFSFIVWCWNARYRQQNMGPPMCILLVHVLYTFYRIWFAWCIRWSRGINTHGLTIKSPRGLRRKYTFIDNYSSAGCRSFAYV